MSYVQVTRIFNAHQKADIGRRHLKVVSIDSLDGFRDFIEIQTTNLLRI